MRIGTLLGIAVGVAACAESPVGPRTLDHTPSLAANAVDHQVMPFNQSVWISCANGGAGEDVALSGELVVTNHEVTDADGGSHTRQMMRPQRVTGVGATSGKKYQGTGMGFWSDGQTSDGGSVYTYVQNFRIIGQGPGNNLLVHMVTHVTTNANGDVTADVDLSSNACK